MKIESFRTPGLGDQTYLMTHEGYGVIVDPQRDIDRFLSVAEERDIELRFILETHLHNDYVSGGVEAARRTGAELVLPASAAPAYAHRAAFHMEDIDGPGFTIRPLHTPGHTPEHTSYVVLLDGAPVAVFSGGSLLVGSAGRPDLLGMARARTLGKLQWTSVNRLAALGDDVELLPTHGAGSFCTASGAGRYTSTIGEEKSTNPVLKAGSADELADMLLERPMPIPAFYKFMGPSNTLGVPDMRNGRVPEMSVSALQMLPEDTVVVDVRPRRLQAQGFMTGSLTIETKDDTGSWAGWLGDHDAPYVLVASPDDDVTEAVTQLAQIGIDDVRGVIRDLTDAPISTFAIQELDEFVAGLSDGDQILDVRMPHEREDVPLAGAFEQFLPDLLTEGVPAGLDLSKPVRIVCATGRRASIAASILARQGARAIVLTDVGAPELAARLASLTNA